MVIHLCHILCMCAYGRVWLWYWLQQQSQNYQENAILAIPSTCKVISRLCYNEEKFASYWFCVFLFMYLLFKGRKMMFLYNYDHTIVITIMLHSLCIACFCLVVVYFIPISILVDFLTVFTSWPRLYVFRCPVDRLALTTQLTPVSAILSKNHVLVQS